MFHNHTRIACILVTLSLALAACGGDEVDIRTDGTEAPAPSDDSQVVTALDVSLALELKNATSYYRICKLSWLYTRLDGVQVSGDIYDGVMLAPGEQRGGSTHIPTAQPATIVGGCWNPNYPYEKPKLIGSYSVPAAISNKRYVITYTESGEVASTSMTSGAY